MKNTILIFAIIAVCSIFKIQAQESPNNCNAVKWASQPNLIIETQTHTIGGFHITTIGNVYRKVFLDVIKYKDINSGNTKSCLRISNNFHNLKKADVEMYQVSIDFDEVEGIINFIKKFQSDILNTKPENYTTIKYCSRTGFKLECSYSGCISIDEKKGYFMYAEEKCWNGSLYFPNDGANIVGMSTVYFKQTEFDELLSLFEQAKVKM
ncbi:MAG TPA: hypothetical protein PKK70_03570 [Candidatus Paceibacterota bacterium]|nr:hypothetical protein [Candidatus Paceibacterota bacterium]